jgi:prophage regulatory protein
MGKATDAPVKPIFLDLQAVIAATSLSEGSLHQLMQEGVFPKPRMLSARRVAWLHREVEEWAEGRPVSDLLPPPNTGKRKSINRGIGSQSLQASPQEA